MHESEETVSDLKAKVAEKERLLDENDKTLNSLRESLREKDGQLIELRESVQKIEQTQETERLAEVDRLRTELARLRQHLVQVEENYTGELVTLEARLAEETEARHHLEQLSSVANQYEEQLR